MAEDVAADDVGECALFEAQVAEALHQVWDAACELLHSVPLPVPLELVVDLDA